MTYEKLDNNELLRLALDAINSDRDAESIEMLKVLLERDPRHVHGQYLLAAQHAQMGLMDRAESGFRAVVAQAPDFPMARFQLGQLLLTKGANGEAKELFAPLVALPAGEALGAFARALSAAADDDAGETIRYLQEGLACPQPVPVLAVDMQRLLGRLTGAEPVASERTAVPTPVAAAPMFLSNYGRLGN